MFVTFFALAHRSTKKNQANSKEPIILKPSEIDKFENNPSEFNQTKFLTDEKKIKKKKVSNSSKSKTSRNYYKAS